MMQLWRVDDIINRIKISKSDYWNSLNMWSFLKKRMFPIGIDMGSSHVKIAQLAYDGRQLRLVSAVAEEIPAEVTLGSSQWQKWSVEAIKKMLSEGLFRGRTVITAMPSDDVFIDQIRVKKNHNSKLAQEVLSNIRGKLPFDPNDAMLQYVIAEPSEQKNTEDIEVLVMATERKKVERHLAIYERANLETKSIGVWPLAITQSYTRFFGRRKTDLDKVVLLIDLGAEHSNIVICKHSKLLFARMVPIGSRNLVSKEIKQRLSLELAACCRHFESLSTTSHIDRMVFLSTPKVEKSICDNMADLASQLQIPAQIGDVLAAVKIDCNNSLRVDRRKSRVDWATAFGLSLS